MIGSLPPHEDISDPFQRYQSGLPTAFQPNIFLSNYPANYPANRLPTLPTTLPTPCSRPPIPPSRLEAPRARSFYPCSDPRFAGATLTSKHSR
jgi:hypothetical protein